jgi:hypothetical protein
MQQRSAAGANSGYANTLAYNVLLLAGGESTNIIFRVPTGGSTNLSSYLGFHDSLSFAAPTDGCYVDIIGTTLTGRCANNSVRTATGTTYTISENVWYRLNIATNAALSLVTYTLYLCTSGAVVWTDTVAANIPTARTTGHGVVSTESAGATQALLDIDYMDIGIERVLVR